MVWICSPTQFLDRFMKSKQLKHLLIASAKDFTQNIHQLKIEVSSKH